MAHSDRSGGAVDGAPPTNKGLLVLAGILLAIPIVALCWVSTYARETPRLGGVPFFFWYQFLWVFITAGLTYAAHRIVLVARNPGSGTTGHAPAADEEDER
jgi:hypothetical protein